MSNPGKLSRSEQSRRNGARSRGPRTESGKRRSAQNSLRHGLYAKTPHMAIQATLVANESRAAYNQFTDLFVSHFDPQSEAELVLARRFAANEWLITRAINVDAGLVNVELAKQQAEFNAEPQPFLTGVREQKRITLAEEAAVKRGPLAAHNLRKLRTLLAARASTLDTLLTLREKFPASERTREVSRMQQLGIRHEPENSAA